MFDANTCVSEIEKAIADWAGVYDQDAERAATIRLLNAWRDLDEHLKAGGDLPADWDVAPLEGNDQTEQPPPETIALARSLLRDNKLVQAVKEIRSATGWGLKESKDYVLGLA